MTSENRTTSFGKRWGLAWSHPTLTGALALLTTLSAFGADLTGYTEEWPPYNYSEGGEIKGISTDVLRAACAIAKLDCDIHMVPWARAYKTAGRTPNTMVYTTARKPSREQEFIWIGPILPRTTWVYVRQDLEKDIHDFSDLAQRQVGVVRDEAAAQDLIAAGVPQSALVQQSSNADVLRLLESKRIDAMVDTEASMQWNLRQTALASVAVSKRMKLSDEGAYYFALNLDSDPALAIRLQDAIHKLRRDGKIDAIARRYGATSKIK